MPVLAHYADLVDSPLPNGQVWAVLIRPKPGTECEQAKVELYAVPVSLPHHAWTTSEVSRRVGFTLQLTQWQHRETVVPNTAVHAFFLDHDPDSENFGQVPPKVMEAWTGDVIAIRADGQELHEHQVLSLLTYLITSIGELLPSLHELKNLQSQLPDDPSQDEAHAVFSKRIIRLQQRMLTKLTPGAYHAYFLQWKAHHVSQGEVEYAGLSSPVEMTLGEGQVSRICGFCEVEGPGLKCGRCKESWYCGRECQKSDWRAGHKEVCGQSVAED